MKCPACFNELTQMQSGVLLVDACHNGCGGVWFDAFELQKADEPGESGDCLLTVARDPGVVVDQNRKRACPRCPEVKLHKHFFSAKRQVQVDQCPSCGGYWLDAGELAAIREEKAQEQVETIGGTGMSPELIRYIYRLSAGPG